LSDALTKHSAKPDELIRAVESGTLRMVDVHPPFRSLLRHKACLMTWIRQYVNPRNNENNRTKQKNEERGFYELKHFATFFTEEVVDEVHTSYC
jgi:hypothetical protein